MPDLPPSKRRPLLDGAASPVAAGGYAELHCKTNFSFLEGASHPDELVAQAAALGYAALAITDRNSVAGVVRAHAAAKSVGLKLLIGAEVTPSDAPPVVLLATDRAAYGRLTRLLTLGRRRAPKGECHLTLDDIAAHSEGLLACVLESRESGQGPGGKNRERLELLRVAGAHRAAEAPEEARGELFFSGSPLLPASTPGADASGSPVGLRIHAAPLVRYREIFGDRCYQLVELHHGDDDGRHLQAVVDEARRHGVPVVAANDVRYHVPERRPLHDVLSAIAAVRPVAEISEQLLANAERHLKSPQQMRELMAACPGAVARTLEIAERCTFSLDELRYEYPHELSPPGVTPMEYLRRLVAEGQVQRYPLGVPEKVSRLLEHELELIEELHYEAYFLTVWDLVRFARARGILCQGRGSAANSAVCYCLGVTAVDPAHIDLLFERFISRERDEAPDIDLDFEHARREEVLQYVYEKYGRERAGMTAEVITYRPRSAIRDVGKALGLSLDRVDALAKTLDRHATGEDWQQRCREAGLDPKSKVVRQMIALVRELLGFPRHLSQHVGGMVITRGPLCEMVPIENAAMADRTVIQWDKDDLDELGILKVDCLALGMLTAIHKALDLVELHWQRPLTLASVPQDDPAVYGMISRADTMGVFQIESRAQMSMLPRLRPSCYYDLVIEVAIVRPGPIQGDMVHPYLRRRAGEEEISYPNDEIREVLHKTLGVPIFQEQAMRLAIVAAGFTPGEADQLRRAMGAWRRPGIMDRFEQKLIDGMQTRGLSTEYAQRVFKQICGFGEYGFPESHAASFALLVYVSAWLKHYYPAAFCAALLNSQPMGFYAPAQLIRNAQEHGVAIRPVDVNASSWDCTLEQEGPGSRGQGPEPEVCGSESVRVAGALRAAEAPEEVSGEVGEKRSPLSPASSPGADASGSPGSLRLGLRMVVGLPEAAGRAIEAARREGPFRSLADLARRTGLGRALLMRLAKAEALRSLQLDRRGGLWQALAMPAEKNRPLLEGLDEDDSLAALSAKALPAMTPYEEVIADYQTTGLSLRNHPLAFFRELLNSHGVLRAADLATCRTDRAVRVAGLVLLRQRPATAKGITFMTLEDETSTANLLVHPGVWRRYHRAASRAKALVVRGHVQRHAEVIHLVADKLEDMAELRGIRSTSRDFQ